MLPYMRTAYKTFLSGFSTARPNVIDISSFHLKCEICFSNDP